jgi:hypothetical protein
MKKLLLFCNNFSEIIIKIKRKEVKLNESSNLFLETFKKLNIASEAAQFYISNEKGNIFNIL